MSLLEKKSRLSTKRQKIIICIWVKRKKSVKQRIEYLKMLERKSLSSIWTMELFFLLTLLRELTSLIIDYEL